MSSEFKSSAVVGVQTVRAERRALVIVALVTGALMLAAAALSAFAPPDFARFVARHRSSDLEVLDRNGALISELRTDFSKFSLRWYRLDEFSPEIIETVIKAEDQRFWNHPGVDPFALLRALVERVRGGPRSGASTITMQVASLLNSRNSRSSSVPAKFRQMVEALTLTLEWNKSEVLEAYLNLVPLRGELRGVPAAARSLYRKFPSGVNEQEAAVLAALLRAPNAASVAVAKRARRLIDVNDEVSFTAVVNQAVVGRVKGIERMQLADAAARFARRRGADFKVLSTTLDATLQRRVQEIVASKIAPLKARNVSDAAVLVVSNSTGEVLAYVASSGALSSAREVDGVQAPRSAGSTLKPFLYGYAFENRLLTPSSELDDSAVNLSVGTALYRPENYDHKFRGWVTVREALAASLNIPAVRALELVGVAGFAQHLRLLGFTIPGDDQRYGLSLALGAAPVSLWQLTNGYRTLANSGVSSPLEILQGQHASSEHTETRVLSEPAAFIISSILSDRTARAETFGLENALSTSYWSAAKTGTSRDMRDNWAVGYTTDYAVGVWVGNLSGGAMWNVTGITGAAPVWREVMDYLEQAFPRIEKARLQSRSVTADVPAGVVRHNDEFYLKGTEPTQFDATANSGAPRKGRGSIEYPPNGVMLAFDPEIPRHNQSLQIKLRDTGDAQFRLVMNGVPVLADANGLYRWFLTPGRHNLELRSGGAETTLYDAVSFVVR